MLNSKHPIRQKSRKIARKYQISAHLATMVAKEEISLREAIQRHNQAEELANLEKQHGISRAEAFTIIRNELTLDEVLQRKQRKEHLQENLLRSIFAMAQEANQELHLWLYGQKSYSGIVKSVQTYSFIWLDEHGEKEIPKLQVKAASFHRYPIQLSDDASLQREPIQRIEERYRIANAELFSFVENKSQLEVELHEGVKITGNLIWIGRYEVGLMNDQGNEISVLRHALQKMKVVE